MRSGRRNTGKNNESGGPSGHAFGFFYAEPSAFRSNVLAIRRNLISIFVLRHLQKGTEISIIKSVVSTEMLRVLNLNTNPYETIFLKEAIPHDQTVR